MNIKGLTIVSIRILGIYFTAKSVQVLPELYSAWFYFKSDTTTAIAVLLGTLVLLATGPLLLVLAKPLSRLTLQGIAGDHLAGGVKVGEIHTIAIATAGLIIVILNLPRLVALMWQLFYSSEPASLLMGETRIFREGLLSHIFEETLLLLFGSFLMVRPNSLVHVLRKLRSFGYETTTS